MSECVSVSVSERVTDLDGHLRELSFLPPVILPIAAIFVTRHTLKLPNMRYLERVTVVCGHTGGW